VSKLEKATADNKYLKMQIEYLNNKNKSFVNLDSDKKPKKRNKKNLNEEDDQI